MWFYSKQDALWKQLYALAGARSGGKYLGKRLDWPGSGAKPPRLGRTRISWRREADSVISTVSDRENNNSQY
ncbi:unnamed protein product, partial [Nesidiocoris tenuis]